MSFLSLVYNYYHSIPISSGFNWWEGYFGIQEKIHLFPYFHYKKIPLIHKRGGGGWEKYQGLACWPGRSLSYYHDAEGTNEHGNSSSWVNENRNECLENLTLLSSSWGRDLRKGTRESGNGIGYESLSIDCTCQIHETDPHLLQISPIEPRHGP